MKKFPLYLLSVSITAAAAWWGGSAVADRVDQSAEPMRAYTLTLDGRSFELEPGKGVELEGKFTNPTAKLTLGDTRRFAYGGIVFDYPAHYVWEADVEDPSLRMWTMDGADVSLIVVRSAFPFPADEYADAVVDSLGESSELQALTRAFGGQVLNGVRFDSAIAGMMLTYEIFEVPVSDGELLLVIMDSTDTGLPSQEFKDLSAMLVETLAPEAVARLLDRKAEIEAEIAVWEVTYDDDHKLLKDLRMQLAEVEAELKRLQQ